MTDDSEKSHSVSISRFGNGAVSFSPRIPGQPATSKTTGNVTINNAAIPESPSFFEVSFDIGVIQKSKGVEISSTLILNVPIAGKPSDTPYSEIEDQAARLLPEMLRSLADLMDEAISEAATGDSSE